MVRHQAPRPDLDLGAAAVRREQVAIKRIILIAEESSRAAVAALVTWCGMLGNDDTSEASHAA